MTELNETGKAPKFDRHLLTMFVVGFLIPYFARIPGIARHGISWFTDYLPTSVGSFLFFGFFNLLPLIALFVLRIFNPGQNKLFWFASTFAFVFLLVIHSLIDLASDAQAAVALVFIPIYSIPVALIGWGVGYLILWLQKKRNV